MSYPPGSLSGRPIAPCPGPDHGLSLARGVWPSVSVAGRSVSMNTLLTSAALRSLEGDRQSAALVRSMEDGGVPCMLLKGAAVARWLYPAGTTRPTGDVDLLVPPSYWDTAAEVLRLEPNSRALLELAAQPMFTLLRPRGPSSLAEVSTLLIDLFA